MASSCRVVALPSEAMQRDVCPGSYLHKHPVGSVTDQHHASFTKLTSDFNLFTENSSNWRSDCIFPYLCTWVRLQDPISGVSQSPQSHQEAERCFGRIRRWIITNNGKCKLLRHGTETLPDPHSTSDVQVLTRWAWQTEPLDCDAASVDELQLFLVVQWMHSWRLVLVTPSIQNATLLRSCNYIILYIYLDFMRIAGF